MGKKNGAKKEKNRPIASDYKFLLFFFVLSFFLFGYLFQNILLSQTISPFYFELLNENNKKIEQGLEKIKNSPFFTQLLIINKKSHNLNIELFLYHQEIKIKNEINQLESVLKRNPKARDVLIKLSHLNNALGNQIKAEEYLRKAKEIDPNIN